MTATVIDALIVTLGLDPKAFKKGSAEAAKAQQALEKNVKDSTKRISDAEKKADDEKARRDREAEARAKAISSGIRKIRNEALTMLAVFTGGVGLTRFMQNTITTAANLGRLSDNLQQSTERIAAWQQASERAGGTSEGAIAQLKESAQEVARFKMGMSSDSMQWFFRMGGSTDDLKDGNSYLLARADIVKKLFDVDPSKAATVAQSMGVSEDQFNLIKQGSEAIRKLLEIREKNAKYTATDAAEAEKLRVKMLDLKDSFELAGTKLLIKLAPAIEKVLNWLQGIAQWINDHRDEIPKWIDEAADKVIPVVKDIVAALRDADWKAIAENIKLVANAFGSVGNEIRSMRDGWNDLFGGKKEVNTPGVSKGGGFKFGKKDALAEDAIRNGRSPSGGRLSGGFIKSANTDKTIAKLVAMGWTPEQAAGIAASFTQESSLDPAARNSKSGAYGIGQWLGGRVADFKAFSGRDLVGSSLEQQLEFFQYEVTRGKEQAAGKKLRASRTAADAAAIHSNDYERPSSDEANVARRQAIAEQYLRDLRAANANAAATVPAAARAVAPTGGSTSTSNVSSETHIEKIEIKTNATDAAGIAKEIGPALKQFGLISQANTGLA